MVFKFHYGLWYGGLVGIIPFMFNYAAEYSGATGTQHGILYTVIPFVALLAKPAICSIADKYAAHHKCLLFFIFTTVLGYGSLAIYPFFPDLIQYHKSTVWILYCLAAVVGNTSMCIVNSIGDSLAINSCQRKDINYGEYRLWGPVGFGLFGSIWGIANEIPFMPKYTPGIITMVVILIANSLLLAFWYDKDEFKILDRVTPQVLESNILTNPKYKNTNTEQRIDVQEVEDDYVANESLKVGRLSLLWKLVRQHSFIFAYILLFTFCGIMTGIHWQFFFRYLEQISTKNNQSFSIIATLALPVQALGGELVFFMISERILKKLGSSLTLLICLLSFTTRFLFYAYLIPNVSVYWILIVELLQGPAFGLMYSVLTLQANYYTEKVVARSLSQANFQYKNSLHATLQVILGEAFEGLGLGLGAIVGGLSYDVAPVLMWQIAGFSSLFVSILCLTGITISPMICASEMSVLTPTNEPSNDGDVVMNEGNEEEYILEELRRIGRSCQSKHSKPKSIREIRADLEGLAKKLDGVNYPSGRELEKNRIVSSTQETTTNT